jgi:valyl-tRNA synthetase
MAAVKSLSPDHLVRPPKTILLEGTEVAIPENAFAPKFSFLEEGAKVDVITIGDVIVTIVKSA